MQSDKSPFARNKPRQHFFFKFIYTSCLHHSLRKPILQVEAIKKTLPKLPSCHLPGALCKALCDVPEPSWSQQHPG